MAASTTAAGQINVCNSDVITLDCPQRNSSRVLEVGLRLMEQYKISRYDMLGPLVAFGADPEVARKALGLRISGNVKKPVQTFYERYRQRLGEETVVKIILELYEASKSSCVCPIGPVVPVGDGYIIQRPSGIYLCGKDGCKEIAPEPITLYDHPQGCQIYDPPLQIVGQPVNAVASQIKRLKVSDPELVARYLLPALCRDLRGFELKTFEFF
jgi:hypothetical protein|nr:MAG: hypothetical protein TU35_08530 [Thermoproteus sp. AZ2]